MLALIDMHRVAFAQAHGGGHTVQLGRGRSLLPGTVITPVSVSEDAHTVTYEARMADDTNPNHMRTFACTIEGIPARAESVVISCDDLGGFARWSLRFDQPVCVVAL